MPWVTWDISLGQCVAVVPHKVRVYLEPLPSSVWERVVPCSAERSKVLPVVLDLYWQVLGQVGENWLWTSVVNNVVRTARIKDAIFELW